MMPCTVGLNTCKKKSIHKIRRNICFIDVLNKVINKNLHKRKTPAWVKELKEIIQDQVDTI